MFTTYYCRKFLRMTGIWNDYEKFVSSIIEGKHLLGSEIFQDLTTSSFDPEEIKQDVLLAETNLERVKIVQKYFNSNKFLAEMQSYEEVLTKNSEISEQLKKKGEVFASTSNFKMAAHCFNLALCYVPDPCELMEEIYIARSKTELHFQNWRGSLRDFKLAEQFERRWKSLSTLTERNLQSDRMLAELDVMEQKLVKDRLKEEEGKQKYLDQVVFQVQQSGEILQSASELVVLKSSNDKGRGLFATADISTGTTLLVEDPYVAVLDAMTVWDMEHCVKCFKRITAIFPCHYCVFAAYCSDQCRVDDFHGNHKYECGCLPFLHTVRADPYVHLGLKALIRVGAQVLFEDFKTDETDSETDGVEEIEGINPQTGLYASDDYHQILRLKSHIVEEDLPSTIWLCIAVATILDTKTDFVSQLKIPDVERKAFLTFLASKLLVHSLSFPYNSIGLSEHKKRDADGNYLTMKGTGKQMVTGVYSLISLLNHSCDSNVFWINQVEGKIAIISNRELKEGEELEFSYGCDYITSEKSIRNEDLLKRYHFLCNCIACTLNWPTYTHLTMRSQWFCTFCREFMRYSQLELIQKCVLQGTVISGLLSCNNCGGMDPSVLFYSWALYHKRRLSEADRKVLTNDPITAIPLIIEAIEFFQTYMSPPSIRMIQAQEMLRDSYEIIVDY